MSKNQIAKKQSEQQVGMCRVPREKVIALEKAIAEQLDPVDFDPLTSHHFAEGVYLRALFLPAGFVAVGKIHKTQHLTIICTGTVRIATDEGIKEITGPAVFVSEPGLKKAAFAVTDTVMMNPHPTNETDLEIIEQKFIAPSFEALDKELQPLLAQQEDE
jgi:hypothetical protein